jgi:hypothetical protein
LVGISRSRKSVAHALLRAASARLPMPGGKGKDRLIDSEAAARYELA